MIKLLKNEIIVGANCVRPGPGAFDKTIEKRDNCRGEHRSSETRGI
ncbi:MAG: hypothetical protein FWF46_08495 [Oscillospiraceae bacterium]|nr:hypothetical protein [Oscillospiraceae bacterium]